jgi:Ca-activated chloride channel family protein
VRLSFQQVLPEDQGTLEWRYPLATERLNGEPVETVTVEVAVASDADLKAVYSPSHAVHVTRDGERRARIAWGRERAVQDRDLVLYLGRSPDAVGFALVSAKPAGEDGTFFAVLAPKATVAEKDRVPKDVVFVLDTSGSMEDGKLEQAVKAVSMGIETLRPVDRFNVIAFSTSVVHFRGAPVLASGENPAAARAWLAGFRATGGTNIEGALRAALSTDAHGRLLLVVFVTDGLPTVGERDPDAIVRGALASNRSKARVFTFGVGADLDVGLLDRIAEGTGGARDYVAGTEELEPATGRFYAKVSEPVLTDVRVDLGPDVYDVYPQRVPDLFAGQQVVLFGRYRAAGTRTLRLTGTVAGKQAAFEAAGTLRADAGPAYLPRLWAQRKVAFLLDAIRLNGEAKELVDEVVRLATRHAIVTPYTSGLVVEDGEIDGLRGASAAPLASLGGPIRRGPGGSVPPGLRTPADPPLPTTSPSDPPPPTTMSPATSAAPAVGGIARSKDLRRRKEAADAEEAARNDPRSVRTVGSRTFVRRRDGRWVEASWDGKDPSRRVVAWSADHLALLASGDEIARILALGDAVVFVWEGKAIEVVPEEPASPPSK